MALPAMWEPSGAVLLEAMASGAPVVIARHGGLPEMINSQVGVEFDSETNGEETQNAKGLAEALLAALALSATDGIRERCRSHAATFSVDALGPRYEQIYKGN